MAAGTGLRSVIISSPARIRLPQLALHRTQPLAATTRNHSGSRALRR